MISGLTRPGLIQTRRLMDWRQRSRCGVRRSGGVAAIAVAFATVSVQPSPARAQTTNPNPACPDSSQDLVMPPEFVSENGILRGTINLTQAYQRLDIGSGNCTGAWLRIFRGEGLRDAPAAEQPVTGVADPIPGPTLRARVGDLIQLALVNQVNSADFGPGLDVDACMTSADPNMRNIYPGDPPFDTPPNCLHASSTANIHFHGTHTNPDATGDNVFLQVRPLPRNNQGVLTTQPSEAMVGFEAFHDSCTTKLRNNPLNPWPTRWSDLPEDYTRRQEALLKAHQADTLRYPRQNLWDRNERVRLAGGWPQYYIGAVPYCFALPEYTEVAWPPPSGGTSPIMGQSPGTHWYHAHKHGSTAINVMNGMTGAFIIEGKYDDDLNTAYGGFMLDSAGTQVPWNTRSQPILVLNQLGANLSLHTGGPEGRGARGGTQTAFTVNGRAVPNVHMQPGEIQLWRIINTSHRSAAYFMAPEDGLQWRQLAQDGVQFADTNYQASRNKPFYLAPANRVDLLVKAPMIETSDTLISDILIQNVMARARVMPTPTNPNDTNTVGTPLMKVTVSGQPVQMEFLPNAPAQPPFLTDISDSELDYITRRLIFNSKAPGSSAQHTINGIQFGNNNDAIVGPVKLGAVEEWTIVNSTPGNVFGDSASEVGPGSIDHPLHIHINPFQITEVFDPNEYLVDPNTGKLEGKFVNGRTVPIPKYIFRESDRDSVHGSEQCVLQGNDSDTWEPCDSGRGSDLVWWDVFAIPSGRVVLNADGEVVQDGGKPLVVPGYFKMRSRFVDYAGSYVLHCHILIHEDRGMMFTVTIERPRERLVVHD